MGESTGPGPAREDIKDGSTGEEELDVGEHESTCIAAEDPAANTARPSRAELSLCCSVDAAQGTPAGGVAPSLILGFMSANARP
jgi:hypothetical protein